jgi:hypothetical protein
MFQMQSPGHGSYKRRNAQYRPRRAEQTEPGGSGEAENGRHTEDDEIAGDEEEAEGARKRGRKHLLPQTAAPVAEKMQA